MHLGRVGAALAARAADRRLGDDRPGRGAGCSGSSWSRSRLTIGARRRPARPDRRPLRPGSGTPAATTARTSGPPGRALLIAASAGALQWGTHELELGWSAKAVVALLGVVGVVRRRPDARARAGTWRMAPRAAIGDARALPADLRVLRHHHLHAAHAGQRARSQSLAAAGIILGVGSLGWSAGSWLQGRDRSGRRERLVAAGRRGCCACGLLLLAATAWFAWPSYLFALALVVGGMGMGCATASLSVLTLALTPPGTTARRPRRCSSPTSSAGSSASRRATAVFAALHRSGRVGR